MNTMLSLIFLITFSCSSGQGLPRKNILKDSSGYVLVSHAEQYRPGASQVNLVNRKGEIEKYWEVDFSPFMSKLDEYGNIYIFGKNKEIPRDKYIGHGINNYFEKRGRDKKIIWKYENDYTHHDFKVLPNKNILFIKYYKLNEANYGKDIWSDEIIEVNPLTNKTVWSWKSHNHINLKKWIARYKSRDLLHCNSINYIKDYYLTKKPALILSCRANSKVYIIDKESKKILWESPIAFFNAQHDASFVDDHTILVFDNGTAISKVIEYDLKKNKISWSYSGASHFFQQTQFFSLVMSGAQRLENGNTLITLGTTGYVLEVSREKKVVWNFFNHHQSHGDDVAWPFKAIFKARFYNSH